EAYHTLKDPVRRATYDAQLANDVAVTPLAAPQDAHEHARRPFRPSRSRWVPAAMAALSLAVFLWAFSRPTPSPLPRAPLPPAPRLLDARSPSPTLAASATVPPPRGISQVLRGPDPLPSEPPPSVRDRLRTVAMVAATAPAEDIGLRPLERTPPRVGASAA